jgi:hypothetical protein
MNRMMKLYIHSSTRIHDAMLIKTGTNLSFYITLGAGIVY